MEKILLASRNPGKAAEFRAMFAPFGVAILSLADFPGAPSPEETGASFEENAVIKAEAARRFGSILSLADDSGLAVEALNGAPGARSARFAGAGADDAANNRLLLEKLAGLPPERRRASFVCVLALASPAGWLRIFRGETHGRILAWPRGTGGFGYDPLFLSDDLGLTFAEAGSGAKGRVSHRGRAFAALAAELPACAGKAERI
jgi:XTP/dITP diphosphohydrolase